MATALCTLWSGGCAGVSSGELALSQPAQAGGATTTAQSAASPFVQATPATAFTANGVSVTQSGPASSSGYRIGSLDLLEVSVFRVPDLSKSVQVSDVGTVSLPLVGEIQAAGRSAREVEQEITHKLAAKYMQNPQVTVVVKEYNSQRVTVEGAVKKPGVYPITGNLSLVQAIATAQGLDDMSDDVVVVFRQVDGKRAAARFNMTEIRGGSSPDPQLQAGDVLVAGKSAAKEALSNILKAVPLASLATVL